MSKRVFWSAIWLLSLAIVYAASVSIASSSLFLKAPSAMAVGVALDLTLTATVLTFLLVVRTRALPQFVMFPVLILGLWIAHSILPAEQRTVVTALTYAWIAVEVALLVFVAIKVGRVVAKLRHRGQHNSLEDVLTAAVGTNWLAVALTQELTILYYGLIGWFLKSPDTGIRDRDVNTWRAVVFVFAFLLVAEGVAVHILVRMWSPTAAVVVSALHIYSLLWLLGDYQAARRNLIRVSDTGLRIACGLRASVVLNGDNVASIEVCEDSETAKKAVKFHLMMSPNLVINLREPTTATLLFGRRKPCQHIGLAVADPQQARDLLHRHLGLQADSQ